MLGSKMNIIDISIWQQGLDLEPLLALNQNLDGVVVKSPGGPLMCSRFVTLGAVVDSE